MTASTPGPSPTPGPGGGVTANVSTHKFGYGPTLTPAMMSDWFPALKLGVPASVTATVTAGQNVYALFVVPPGGSLTFKVTTSSTSGGWYWQWNSVNNYWVTPELYFYEGQFVTLNAGTTWAFGLDYNTYAGSGDAHHRADRHHAALRLTAQPRRAGRTLDATASWLGLPRGWDDRKRHASIIDRV